jgi:hypothetical protein
MHRRYGMKERVLLNVPLVVAMLATFGMLRLAGMSEGRRALSAWIAGLVAWVTALVWWHRRRYPPA